MDALVDAARTSDVNVLRRLVCLETVPDGPSAHNIALQAACHAAALRDHPLALDILLDRGGCYVDTKTILAALKGKSKEVFDGLVTRGWDINGTMSHMGDVLIMSVGDDNLDMVQFFLSRGSNPNLNRSMGSSSALELAGYHASVPVIAALLEAGAVMKGSAALRNAAYNGRTSIITYLLDHGAEIDEIPDEPDLGLIEELPKKRDRNALCEVAARGHSPAVELLLERGADTSVRDSHGNSALELAQRGGHTSCVELLSQWTIS